MTQWNGFFYFPFMQKSLFQFAVIRLYHRNECFPHHLPRLLHHQRFSGAAGHVAETYLCEWSFADSGMIQKETFRVSLKVKQSREWGLKARKQATLCEHEMS